ncbi:velvet factor-domain-containing protein [Crucibulum laeve]|uniref:Velvet factor-domain-containing protein n=1 Tax=Crucibulum laeve TaxID=68775 RepID=A0A5C3M222_9AGAR|nr:velvet factor-domain-containing protein [Crucibulum laeve]
MVRTIHDIHDFLDNERTPYRLKPDIHEVRFRRSTFFSKCTVYVTLLESRRLWRCRLLQQSKQYCLPAKSIKAFKNSRHVSSSTPASSSIRRSQINQGTLYESTVPLNYSSDEVCDFSIHPELTVAGTSSGHSSPHSSFNSAIFSSGGSNSSLSPPSSQGSFTELSPPPLSPFVRRQPRIQVSSLLSVPHTRSYHLEVIQHPLRTAEFGMANLSRLPLTPPIIAQLTVRDPSGNSVIPDSELPFLIAHLSLFSDDGVTPLDMGSAIGRGQSPPILYGNLVSSVDQLEDLQGNMGLFFLFPDVSIRWRGRYQLGVTLSRISGAGSSGAFNLGVHGTPLAEARTHNFDVLALNQYTAAPPTRLTQCFLRQGARMFTFMSPSP